jgi:hypothetical protein
MNKWVNFTSSGTLFDSVVGEQCKVMIKPEKTPLGLTLALDYAAKLSNGEIWMRDRYAPLDGWARYDVGDNLEVVR